MTPQDKVEQHVSRTFVQPPDAPSFFADFVQITGTDDEFHLQFYQTIPGPPAGPANIVVDAKTYLRCTITFTPGHFARLVKALDAVAKSSGASTTASAAPGDRA